MSLPEPRGPWQRERVLAFLHGAAMPVRLATSGSSGPMVQSLWFDVDDDALWCATQRDALVVRRLQADPRCGFEVAGDAPPYRGVRGTAVASVLPEQGERVLRRLLGKYLGASPSPLRDWLLSRVDAEVALRLDPQTLVSWDYTARMGAGGGPRGSSW